MNTIMWRLHEPFIESGHRRRWTKVHRVSMHASDLTACHMLIPEHPYDVARDEWIPADAPLCKRCLHPDHREA